MGGFYFLCILCWCIGVSLSSPVSYLGSRGCLADHDCPDDYFCFQRSQRCVKCTNCTIYLREFSSIFKCSKTPLNCGPCLERYEEVPFEGGGVAEMCVLKMNVEENFEAEMMHSHTSIWLWAGGTLMFAVMVVSVVINTTVLFRSRSVRRPPDMSNEPLMQPTPSGSLPNIQPSAPPPPYSGRYSPEERGYSNAECREECSSADYAFTIECKEENRLNQAAKFREANYEDTDESPPESYQPEPEFLHNEDTRESPWTPNPQSEPRVTTNPAPEHNPMVSRFRRAFSVGDNERCSRCSVHCPSPCPDHGPEPKRPCIRQSATTDFSSSDEPEDCESQTTQNCFEEQTSSSQETFEHDDD